MLDDALGDALNERTGRAGINIAQTFDSYSLSEHLKIRSKGVLGQMKEVANSLAQLAFIIMLLVTLAIWTAAASQWLSGTDSAPASAPSHHATFVAGAR